MHIVSYSSKQLYECRINDKLIGQTLLATSQFPRMNSFSIKNLPPAQALHLVEPLVGDHLPYYKMLKKRSPYDKVAQAFLQREKCANEMYLRGHSRKFPSRRKSLKERSI
uniref:KTSC domain-containing protein n=1 Tax=Angiostrongylus cantonensis TaxID=6313 RepID=A0A0K0CWS3_ANGCA